ncbi:MAG: hypothetical protein L0212_04025 [Acidobacteria bacterium]|nr:hypothetical protein [Acidobacteriota bacterium]
MPLSDQQRRLLALLDSAEGGWVPLPRILALTPKIAQYNARIHELRAKGFPIENRIIERVGGECHTEFRLVKRTVPAAAGADEAARKRTVLGDGSTSGQKGRGDPPPLSPETDNARAAELSDHPRRKPMEAANGRAPASASVDGRARPAASQLEMFGGPEAASRQQGGVQP